MANYTLQINNKSYRVDVEEDTLLLWVLRDHLGLVGTKYGCGTYHRIREAVALAATKRK